MPAPDMISGMRQPRSVRLEDIRKGTDAANELPSPRHAPDGITVYVSPYRRYRVQVTAPSAYIDPASGRKNTGGKMHVAEFEEGIFRNNDRDPKVRELFDDALQSNKYFGKFGGGPQVHFWLAKDQSEQMEAGRIRGALDTLKALPPEMVAEYMAQLTQGADEDHDLAPAAEAKPAQRPTAKPIAQG